LRRFYTIAKFSVLKGVVNGKKTSCIQLGKTLQLLRNNKLESARKSAYLCQAKCAQTDTHMDKSNLIIFSNSLRSIGGDNNIVN